MRTTITQNPPGRQSALANLTMADIVTLMSAFIMLIGFTLLPWLHQNGASATGLNLLTLSTSPLSTDLLVVVQQRQGLLLLIPAAALLALGALVWGVLQPRYRPLAAWLVRLAGLLGIVYYLLFGAFDRENTTFTLFQFSGGGFWLAFYAAAALLLQFLVLRPAAESHLTTAVPGVGSWWGPLTSRIADNPRFIRAVAFIFRFQSFFGLIIVVVLAILLSPSRNGNNLFISQRNLSNVARDVAETGVLAVGQILVIIIGGIDLSVGSVVALTATGSAFLLMRDLFPAIPAIMLILGLGLFIGWWNGWSSERFKIPPFITTLAMLSIARGIAHIWSNDIAVPVSYGAGGADPLFEIIGERINGVFPVPAIIMFIVAIIMSLILHYTAFGRHLYAIGGNQTAARLSGLAVSRIKIAAFMLCSFFAAMAGILHAAQLNQGSPNEAVNYELNAIAAVVIGGASLSGGKGTVAGAIAGAFILGILDNMLSLNNVNSNITLVTKGLLVVGAVALQQLRPRNGE
ncbi:MAG TPA: ABC transporter permease [Phototrophicaceae bacterium]|nr:ABC transporter permease [Phototrophicaceae bacterium]